MEQQLQLLQEPRSYKDIITDRIANGIAQRDGYCGGPIKKHHDMAQYVMEEIGKAINYLYEESNLE